jgi:beta-galactosidase/beta-glucuronidase
MIDRSDYPRPLLYRETWTNLNGIWDFAFDDFDNGPDAGWRGGFAPTHRIRVPFSYETKASGIADTSVHPVVWYQKRIDTADVGPDETLLIHFEGSDYRTTVYANGTELCTHEGGYARFSVDLAPVLPNKSVLLVVRITDSLSKEQPRGKQRFKPESWGCWYVQTTGIWKTVWAERVGRERIEALTVTPDPETGTVAVSAASSCPERFSDRQLRITLYDGDREIAATEAQSDDRACWRCESSIPAPRRWSTEDPYLYDIRIELLREGRVLDTVWSYFGFRTVAWDRNGVYLNGKRTYLRLVLDQGYWPDSGLTPPDCDALKTDLDAVVRYGYNGVRKHQKIEDQRFLYLCDTRGILVFSEFAAAYAYSEKASRTFLAQWEAAVCQHRQHPSIIAWVPFNESWGIGDVAHDPAQQAFTEETVRRTKALDPTRPVISNDGWEHTVSDLVTIHDYRETGEELIELHGDGDADVIRGKRSYSWYGQKLFAEGYAYRDQPLLLSEYGGIAFKTAEGWGYGNQVEDERAFLRRFLSQNDAIRRMPQYSGFCYTQLSDVEQEKNGLLTADRRDKLSEAGVEAVRNSNRSFN